ncbi:MAG: type VI secretion system tip protein VgrG [Pseudomonadota bacterium]
MAVTQATREARITSALADDVLLFYRMTGSEQLGRLFEYRVQLMSATDDVKIADVLGTTMALHLDLPDGSTRHFNGIVTRFCSTGWNGSFATYEAVVHPWLWLLTRASNCRIFQDMTAIDIVKAVTGDPMYAGLVNLDVSLLSGTCEARTYCVQYRETDFNFVCRLLEEEGIYYYFSQEETKHTMVLADSYGAHDTITGYDAVIFRGEGSRAIDDEAVTHWSAGGEIQSSVYVLNDFDFEKASSSTSGGLLVKATVAAAFDQSSYEMFDYPGGYVKAAVGTTLARGRMEAIHGQCEQIEAKGTARGLYPGGLFGLTEHPREDQNRDYLVTGATYDIAGDDYSSESTTAGELLFSCAFTAVGKEHSYRAPPIMKKPYVQGPQTAMVVGKAGEEIWTDKYGRVKVQFHWDRLGKENETSSCWVRVSQSWAGKGWGAMFIPRIGMEVVVSFLEGDPDQPLITGCVYNGDAMPPYALPAEQTKSTIKSNTSLGGGGFNEIRFEDKKDSEEIFVQAEKDFNRVVKNNDTLSVGFEKADKGDQTIKINNDQSLDVGNDQSVTIGNDQTESVGNNMTVSITKDHSVSVGGNQSNKIDGDQATDVGKTCVIEAKTSITLKVGGSSIKIEPAKITIHSTEIAISSDANMKVEAGAMMTTKSTAVMTIQGALVKIN